MNNQLRRHLLNRHRASGFPGSILDVYRAYDQGVDLISQYEQQQMMQQQQPQVAQTPEEQREGLRPQHAAGNTNASMIFPNVPGGQPFNTVGMRAPIDIKKFDEQGHLVKSYDSVPPGIQSLPMGPQRGTVLETPAQMQWGGPKAGPRAPELSDAEMSLKIIQEANAGNPAARRMRSDYGQRMFLPGETEPSTHYMASFDNYAVPLVQEDYIGGPLSYNPNPAPSKADFRFDTPEQAAYFAENYKEASAAKAFQEKKRGGVRKYQEAGPLNFSATTPDWRATGPGLRIDGQTYQNSELTGSTRIPLNPETGEQLPIILPAAEVVGRRNYDDSIQEAISRTNSGLLGSQASAQDYAEMEDAVRSGMNTAGKNLMAAGFDILSSPQRYFVNAPLAYAKGKTPNLSMFPSGDRNLGINEPNAYPSETLGIENPIGALAVDVLTDPGMMIGLGTGATRLGTRATQGLYRGAINSMSNPASKLGRQLYKYRNSLIEGLYPSKAKDLGDVSIASEQARNALRNHGTVIGTEGKITNPAANMERYRLNTSVAGEGNVRRAVLDRLNGRYPKISSNLKLSSKSGSFDAEMRFPDPATGTPGHLRNFHFVDDSKLSAGRIASDLSSMIPKLEGEWLINPGSLSGDSFGLWHNILNRKIPNTPQFTIATSSYIPNLNRMGRHSALSKKLGTGSLNNHSFAETQDILDMTQRIAGPTFQRYGVAPPWLPEAGRYPDVTLHKLYKAGGVKTGVGKNVKRKLHRR